MELLAIFYFKLCMNTMIPNPHTVQYLPQHQQEAIIQYSEWHCQREVDVTMNMLDPHTLFDPNLAPQCEEDQKCM
jgi:hypothetical protein